MNFQIINLIIWPKDSTFSPQIIKFEKGKVNIITGGSRTGKSAIIPIIDYCLASSECNIPIDTIRDNAAWYGLLFETANQRILIARKGPEGRASSDEFYLARGSETDIPHQIYAANEKTNGIKLILNTLAGTPYFRLAGSDDSRPYQERLGFRDLMALIFQSQEVVANQNILFYKTHAHEHRERLKNWLPYILGAENLDVLAARQSLSAVQLKLSQLKRELEKANKVSERWLSNMNGHLSVAKTYGLLEERFSGSEDAGTLLQMARSIVESPPSAPQPTTAQIENSNSELIALEKQEDITSDNISLLRKRLGDLAKLKAGFLAYGGTTKRRADRLHISQWLGNFSTEEHNCPLCGEANQTSTHDELRKISSAFKRIEDEANKTQEIPTSFLREEETLKRSLSEALDTRKALSARIDRVLANNKATRDQFDRRQSMYFFLGHLKSSLETFESLTVGGNFAEEIANLEDEEKKLLKLVNPEAVARKLNAALVQVSQKALVRLQTLDAEDKYKKIPPQFSVKDLSLKVQSNDGYFHFLAEVGSASNWLSFHIAFICALHEYFNEMGDSCVPGFAVFDQPSQVYFPKTRKVLPGEENIQYDDEDVEAVVGIFKTLANSVREQKGKWQCIVLDHAREEIYNGIDEVHEVAVWRDGEKLIPTSWYAATTSS